MQDNWSNKLSSQAYAVLRQSQTEVPGSGKLLYNKKAGLYLCGACQQQLFSSQHKFDAKSGWPSFFKVINQQAILKRVDHSHNLKRTEVLCRSCQSHLGHVFKDAYDTPTKTRYCINSLALKFQETTNNKKSK
ncbi:MAG: peptide-methionine (R)-S-oxide reductase MsrB [Candidatus Saccharibacteria bacterium]|nr:peptide-methionine (R)-S-oxide reductase MsrB [Candidatus Saccharibacteria bacterium]MCY4088843.1 peptide-methionine (R)-S-oxide reductase MsrB [Candidatus Saccharibacteria bacterium]